jgi:hypothetical protein
MSTTVHPVAPEEVMAFLDGELSPADAQAIAAHLERCAECNALAEQFRSTSRLLSIWHVQAVPVKLEERVTDLAAKTCSGLSIGKSSLLIRANFWTWRQWAIGSGGTLAALLLVLAFFLPSLDRSGSAGSGAKLEAVAPQGRERQTESESLDRGSGAAAPMPDRKSKPISGRTFSGLVTLNTPRIAADSTGNSRGFGDPAANSFSGNGQLAGDQLAAGAPMIARTVSLSVVVKDFAASRSSLDSILARHHGYSAQLNVSTPENDARHLQASLRIPSAELSFAVADLKAVGRVENESQSGEEVTQQHTDLLIRLKNSRETERRLRTILQQRTGNVAEVLQVEEEIARVRTEIESAEAQQKALEHRVDFVSVDLQLTEEYKAQLNAPAASVPTRMHNAFVAGCRGGLETAIGIVLFFAEEGPTLLIWLLILALPILLLWRRFRRKIAAL